MQALNKEKTNLKDISLNLDVLTSPIFEKDKEVNLQDNSINMTLQFSSYQNAATTDPLEITIKAPLETHQKEQGHFKNNDNRKTRTSRSQE